METKMSEAQAALIWIILLTAASTIAALTLACGTPFAALSGLAALHLRRQDGVLLVIVAWLASQVIGFGVHHYGHDPKTIIWAFGIGVAAVCSALGAQAVAARSKRWPIVLRIAAAFLAAFIAYNALLAICALGLGGITTTLDPANLARQFLRSGAVLVVLLALHRVVLAMGMPALSPGKETAQC